MKCFIALLVLMAAFIIWAMFQTTVKPEWKGLFCVVVLLALNCGLFWAAFVKHR